MNLNNKKKITYLIFCICFTWFVNCWLAQYTIGLKEGIYIYSFDFNSLIDSLYGSLFIPAVIIFICVFYIIKDFPPTKSDSDMKNIKRFKIFLFLNIIAFILINYYVSYDTIILFS